MIACRVRFTLLALLILFTAAPPLAARDSWQDVPRIVAVGDLHGDYDQYIEVLRMAQLIGPDDQWAAGETHFVQLGDVPDRGPDSQRIEQHLQGLVKQARKAGGAVHRLLGNHEVMNVVGDLRYVSPGEYAALVTPDSKRLQNDYFARFVAQLYGGNEAEAGIDDAFIADWKRRFPLGYVEHRRLWGPRGDTGRDVRKRNTMIRINRTLFAHAGPNPHETLLSLRKLNNAVRRELKAETLEDTALVLREDGPLWYRGYATAPANTELPALLALLEFYDADRIVLGHTPTPGAIVPRFNGLALLADVGLSAAYGGRLACLLIEGDEVFALHRGVKVPLPRSVDDRLPYFKRVAALDPPPSPLLPTIERLQQPAAEQAPAGP